MRAYALRRPSCVTLAVGLNILIACCPVAGQPPGQGVPPRERQAAAREDGPSQAIIEDWQLQDGVARDGAYDQTVKRIVARPGRCGRLASRDGTTRQDRRSGPRSAMERTVSSRLRPAAGRPACATLLQKAPRIVFTKHYDLGGSHYAYTEGQSDAQAERHFDAGASLCLLKMEGICMAQIGTLLDDRQGVIRDPDVSYDGRRVLFAWKKSLDQDDYHLYEMNVGQRRRPPVDLRARFCRLRGGVCCPQGQIVFNSTRCVQTVDCWWTEVSNLYTCDGDGRYLRRLGFRPGSLELSDHDARRPGALHPLGIQRPRADIPAGAVPDEPRRHAARPHATATTPGFPLPSCMPGRSPARRRSSRSFRATIRCKRAGSASWSPPAAARRMKGRNSSRRCAGRKPCAIDAYGQSGDQFQYPYPLSEAEFLVSLHPAGAAGHFGAVLD